MDGKNRPQKKGGREKRAIKKEQKPKQFSLLKGISRGAKDWLLRGGAGRASENKGKVRSLKVLGKELSLTLGAFSTHHGVAGLLQSSSALERDPCGRRVSSLRRILSRGKQIASCKKYNAYGKGKSRVVLRTCGGFHASQRVAHGMRPRTQKA